jgi:hypothetical protein
MTMTTGLDASLDQQYRDLSDSAVRNVLATDLALQTYAHITEGLPLYNVVSDQYRHRSAWSYHPVARHTSLCPGATETAQDFLSEVTIGTLSFDDEVSWPLASTIRSPVIHSSLVTATPRIPVDASQLSQPPLPSY